MPKLASTTRIPLPMAAAVSLILAIAPAYAEGDALQPAGDIVAEQPLDQDQELIGEEEIVEEQTSEPALEDNAGAELSGEDVAAEPEDSAQVEEPAILVDPSIAPDGAEELPPLDGQAAAGDELQPAPEDGQAAEGGSDLLPADDAQAVSGDAALPPADGEDASASQMQAAPAEQDQAVTGDELQPAPDDGQAAAGDELLPAPDDGQAAAEGENNLLPADDAQAVTGDELLPPADGEPESSGELLAAPSDNEAVEPESETVTIDQNAPKQAVIIPQGMVRIIIQNKSSAPMDLFMDARDDSDPIWVMTLNPGFQVSQPSNPGQAWRIAQNSEWTTGFEASDKAVQLVQFDGKNL